jgi:hypothetical protein
MGAKDRRRTDVVHSAVLVIGTLAVAVIVVNLKPLHPAINANASAIVGSVFLLATWAMILMRKEHPADYGLSLDGWLGEMVMVAILALVSFPPFLVGFRIWWSPPGGFDWNLPWPVWQLAATHLFVVALPEEFLYRGFVQQRLSKVFTSRVEILGARVGWAVPVTAAVFALGHFVTDFRPDRLATFFPALLFGWLKEKRSSLVAPVLFHAACNVFSDILTAGYFR